LIQCRGLHNSRKPNVKDLVGAAYWVLVGALVAPALYFTLFYPGPAYLLMIPIAMGLVGVLLAGLRNVWALLIGFGGLPALVLTWHLLTDALRIDWSCSSITFGNVHTGYGYAAPNGEQVICETIPGQFIVMAAVFWGITVFGFVLWIATRRLADTGRAA
jgi:hypothetical protein